MNAQELEVGLNKITSQVGKVAKEQSDRFDAATARIAELEALIEAGGTIGPAITTAFEGVQTAMDNLDAVIPDPPQS